MSDIMAARVKRTLRHCDVKVGHQYKVVRQPDYWPRQIVYKQLNKIGVCQWINIAHGVSLLFDDSVQRIVRFDCLEEVVENTKLKMELNADNLVVGRNYKVIKIPPFWIDNVYPVLDRIGKLKKIVGQGCILYFGSETNQHFLPFDCIEEASVIEIADDFLVKQIANNPWGALKLVRGLAKMTKDLHLRAFVERGIIV